jgi:hypothetical protein
MTSEHIDAATDSGKHPELSRALRPFTPNFNPEEGFSAPEGSKVSSQKRKKIPGIGRSSRLSIKFVIFHGL